MQRDFESITSLKLIDNTQAQLTSATFHYFMDD